MSTAHGPPALELAQWGSDSSGNDVNNDSSKSSLSSDTSSSGREHESSSLSLSSSSSMSSYTSSPSSNPDSASSSQGRPTAHENGRVEAVSRPASESANGMSSMVAKTSGSYGSSNHNSNSTSTSTSDSNSVTASSEASPTMTSKTRDHIVVHVPSQAPPAKAKAGQVSTSDHGEQARQDEADEQEVPVCRICWDTDGTLIRPCGCKGTQEFVHLDCIKKWETAQLSNPRFVRGICPTCKGHYDRGIVPAQITERIREVTTNNRSVRYLFYIVTGLALSLGVVVPSLLLAYPESDMYQRSDGSKTSLYWLFYLSCVIGWTAQCVVLVVVQGYTRTATFLRAPAPRQFLVFSIASFYLPVYLCLFFASLLMEHGHSQWSLYARMLGMGGVAWILVGISHMIMYSVFQCCRFLYYWSIRRRERNAANANRA